jgi:hypothetical protein
MPAETFSNEIGMDSEIWNCWINCPTLLNNSTSKTVDALMKLELPSGVEVEIKAS